MKPTSSKGKSPWTVKKVTGATRAGGMVIPKGAILANQGLGKIKLEEDFVEKKSDVSLLTVIENDVVSGSTTAEAVSGEEYVVTKVEVDIPVSPEQTTAPREDDGYGNSSCSSCQEEIESLNGAVRDLTPQLEKQNEAIRKQEEAFKKQEEVIRKQDEKIKRHVEFIKKQDGKIKRHVEFIKKQDEFIKKQDEFIQLLRDFIEFIRNQDEAIKKPDEVIKKLDEVIKMLDEVIKKPNDVIAEMKSFIRNIGLSMTTYGKDGGIEDEGRHDVRNGEQSAEKDSGPTAESSLIDNAKRTGDPTDEPPEQIPENDNMNTHDGEDDDDDNEDSSNSTDTEDNQGNAVKLVKRRKLITVEYCNCGRHRGFGSTCSRCKKALRNPRYSGR